MSYNTISKCAGDQALQSRVTACVAQEGVDEPQPVAYKLMWPISTRSDIEAAYASALAAGSTNPGGDESVISDQMILSAVQQEIPNLPTS